MREHEPKRKCILVADDEKDALEVLGVRLESAGYSVVKADTGKEALSKVHDHVPDLILLDLVMPGMDGVEVKNSLNKEGDFSKIPVIFLTGQQEIEYKLKGFQSGIDDYVTKPFDGKELLARIDAVIKRKEFYEKMSMTDALTGLYNLHYFKAQFEQAFNAAKRYEHVFSIAVIDVDDFKSINDNYSHAVGDLVLQEVARIIKSTLRETDVVTRYGGDEFLVILPNTDDAQAAKAIDRLKGAFRGRNLRFDTRGIELPVSISVGVAAFNENLSTKEDMFDLADKDMFSDKRSGKDKR